jgi:ketosteroid isomerase-like protein
MHDVATAFETFIAAFNALDFERFRRCLAPEVTLFAPRASDAALIEGVAAVEAHFAAVFQAETPAGPGIRPKRLRTASLAGRSAVVTFEFERPDDSIGRRTLVFHAIEGEWKIAHIHASNL